jgi:hypothetical protein
MELEEMKKVRPIKDIEKYWSEPIKLDCDTIQTAVEDIRILIAEISNLKQLSIKAGKEIKYLRSCIVDQADKQIEINMLKEKLAEAENGICEWVYDGNYDYFITSCGNDYCLIDGTLKENLITYCHGCGKKILEKSVENN